MWAHSAAGKPTHTGQSKAFLWRVVVVICRWVHEFCRVLFPPASGIVLNTGRVHARYSQTCRSAAWAIPNETWEPKALGHVLKDLLDVRKGSGSSCAHLHYWPFDFKLLLWMRVGLRGGHRYGDDSVTKFPCMWGLNLYRFSCINRRNVSFSPVLED